MKLLFSLLVLLLSLSTTGFAQQLNTADSLYNIEDSILIPTRSGINISAIIVRKKTNTNPLPAILFYTTYYQGVGDANFGKRSADRDYAGVVAYVRGIRTDNNNYAPYENEGTDVYDIIDWISKQPWCNGTVGMLGGSYTGYAQWATVKNIHPALKTIVPQVAVMPGFDMPMENNVQNNIALYWPYQNIYTKQPIRRSLPFEWFEAGTSFRSLDSLAGVPNPIFQKWMQHPTYDAYWKKMVPTAKEYAQLNIPVLSTTGYYDGAQIAALQYYKLHTRYNKNANHYFVIGPYDHWGGQSRAAKNLMGYEIDSAALVNMRDLAYDWLDWVLKGKQKPSLLKDKINIQIMGANRWMHTSALTTTSNDTLIFYLNNQTLVSEKPKIKAYSSQTIDFRNRQNENNFYFPQIIVDTLNSSNGLVFKTAPFQKEFIINGSFLGNLFLTVNKRDIDISLALFEQMPNGQYFYLTRYLGRASYSKDNSRRQLLQPGKTESIPFEITRFISKRISKGSRLVILLNTNKQPFEIINYGSGKEVIDETINDAGMPLQIKWHNHSYLKIPIWK
ncbi:hypothetical protein IQ13_4216 [Lacibacter cauensis]|uniref:Xaa-Pro dipeptidyl-peptidase C-terminal domain-containing protein n=1 Tax=Lacibacter cauensis TaxID=510947 RepID=A0A562SA12_9BACT|nr:CocE/NonD family hydrolase [Lacibacter cauensis]TWI77973.1 hypothetical protein IQ13_4216 [Lacibacter cauensis]